MQTAPPAKKQKSDAVQKTDAVCQSYTSPDCPQCKKIASGAVPILWEDAHFLVVHKRPPCGVVGHLQLLSKRHFQGPSSMTDAEAVALGPALKHCEAALEQMTNCDRVYTAALGSAKSGSHFHAHMVPLYVDSGGDPAAAGTAPHHVTGTPFDVFLQEDEAKKDPSKGADEAKCQAVAEAFKQAMAARASEEQEDR